MSIAPYKLYLFFAAIIVSSCSMKKESSAGLRSSSEKIIIPFEITKSNNIVFKTILNNTDTIDLFFDTGGTQIVMKHDAIKNSTTLLKGKNAAYREENFVPLESFNTLSIGSLSWDSLIIYPVGVGPEETAGHFGWDLFENMIVELDYDKKQMVIHQSLTKNLADYAKLPIEYINTLFCVNGTVSVNAHSYSNRYLFDTGFQKALLLDKDLNRKDLFPDTLPIIKESKLKNSMGDVFINKIVMTDKICLGSSCSQKVPAHILELPNPARFETHILGNELLMRFNTILDFQNHFVYLKPNSLSGLKYSDAA